MRILFMGTPSFAVPSLGAIAERWEVAGVVTQPDRPSGRGMRLKPPPVKEFAENMGLEVFQPGSKRELAALVRRVMPDCIVVVAFGMILPRSVLNVPPLGCINLHASLLPRLRGADPIRRALMSGEEVTGNTVILINERMDAGDILSSEEVAILPEDNAETLSERLARKGAVLLKKTLERWLSGGIKPVPQRESEATYAPPLLPEEFRICWRADSSSVVNRVRACYPDGYFYFRSKRVKVLRAEEWEGSGDPGEVLDPANFVVACGRGAVRILEVITPKGRRAEGREFVRGYRPERGELLK
jgi:methionyl-tRNA formyltransferase